MNAEFGFSRLRPTCAVIVWLLVLLACEGAGAWFIVAGLRGDAAVFVAFLLPVALVSEAAGVYMTWFIARAIPRTMFARVRANADGIVLDARGSPSWRWDEIAEFAVGLVETDDEGNTFVRPAMMLRNGDRVDLEALARSNFLGRSERDLAQIVPRVSALNDLRGQPGALGAIGLVKPRNR